MAKQSREEDSKKDILLVNSSTKSGAEDARYFLLNAAEEAKVAVFHACDEDSENIAALITEKRDSPLLGISDLSGTYAKRTATDLLREHKHYDAYVFVAPTSGYQQLSAHFNN